MDTPRHPPHRTALLTTVAAGLLATVGIAYLAGPPLVAVYPVERVDLVQQLVASGRVVSASRVQVGSEIVGVVAQRLVREGDSVQAGQVLIVLEARDLEARVREAHAALEELRQSLRPQAEVALDEASARLQRARREHERARTLLDRELIAVEAVEQAAELETLAAAAAERARLQLAAVGAGGVQESILRERLAAAEAALARTEIRTVVGGTVLTRRVEPGDLVQPGQVLLEVGRDNGRELLVPFDERHLGNLNVGQPALCVTDAQPDRPFEAVVSFIAPTVDPARGTVDVRLLMPDEPADLRQDMTVSVSVETARRSEALAIPNDALIDARGAAATVYRVREGRVEEVTVGLGLRGLAQTEITTGLDDGDRVLADHAAVTPGQRVRVRLLEAPRPRDTARSRALDVRFN